MQMKTLKLNFGCGNDIKKGYENADITNFKGVDKTFDFNITPYPYTDNYFKYIYSDNVLEHLDSIPDVMKELHRITCKNGTIRIIVPYYNCYGAYNDVTHKHYFSHLAFEPFYKKNNRGNYFIKEKFKLIEIKLIPTRIGKLLIFDQIRLPLSHIFGQIYQTIDITLKVIK